MSVELREWADRSKLANTRTEPVINSNSAMVIAAAILATRASVVGWSTECAASA
jgi:hypothetical protein